MLDFLLFSIGVFLLALSVFVVAFAGAFVWSMVRNAERRRKDGVP
jgi:uncharacterized membrane protein YidH (DUF202 family)